jgi:hypothetical protein
VVNKPETINNACVAVCTCGWRSSPYFFENEGGEDCAKVSAIIETRLGHLNSSAAENSNGNKHQITYEKVIAETS